MKRCVITGIGIISSIGNNQNEVLRSLLKSNSGIIYSKEFKYYGMKSQVCGNIKLNLNNLIDKKKLRFMSNSSIYAYIAMEQAINDSKLKYNMISNYRTGLIVGSGFGARHNTIISADIIKLKGIRYLSPYMVIKNMNSSISACLSTFFKIKGLNYSINSACSTSTNCIGHAYDMIKYGKQDIIFAGAGEELSWEIACEFDAMNALSSHYNKTPSKASRPYDKNRDGFVISCGGGIIVIEELEHALSRNINIYAEIIGYGNSSNGVSMVAPYINGAFRSMKISLCNINKKIDYINTHATSTIIGDTVELLAIKKIFKNINIPFISSTKCITGHSLSVSGVHEIIFSILMLNNNFISPNINIDNLDSNANNMNIVNKLIFTKLNTIMINNFGFGGTNATIIISKYNY